MTHAQQMRDWAARRKELIKLRDKDPEFWTFRQLGLKFGVTAERARQIYRNGNGVFSGTPSGVSTGKQG